MTPAEMLALADEAVAQLPAVESWEEPEPGVYIGKGPGVTFTLAICDQHEIAACTFTEKSAIVNLPGEHARKVKEAALG